MFAAVAVPAPAFDFAAVATVVATIVVAAAIAAPFVAIAATAAVAAAVVAIAIVLTSSVVVAANVVTAAAAAVASDITSCCFYKRKIPSASPPLPFSSEHQWLQFDLGPPARITGVVTRGQGDKPRRFVTSYTLSYSNDSSTWHPYKEEANNLDPRVFRGNSDASSERRHFLSHPVTARFLRVHPVTWHRRIGMRAAVIGCPHRGPGCQPGFMQVNRGAPCGEGGIFYYFFLGVIVVVAFATFNSTAVDPSFTTRYVRRCYENKVSLLQLSSQKRRRQKGDSTVAIGSPSFLLSLFRVSTSASVYTHRDGPTFFLPEVNSLFRVSIVAFLYPPTRTSCDTKNARSQSFYPPIKSSRSRNPRK